MTNSKMRGVRPWSVPRTGSATGQRWWAFALLFCLLLMPQTARAQGTIVTGENHAGSIAVPGQLHDWTFSASQGDYVAVSVAREAPFDANFTPWIRLISPTGALLETRVGTVASISRAMTATGTYTVIVGSGTTTSALNSTGSYRLTLARAPAEFVVPTDDQGGPLTNGQNHAGFVHFGDLDMWTFSASQGDYVAVSIGREAPFDANFTPWIRLISPTGALLETRVGTVASISRAMTATGTYTVIVGSGTTTSALNSTGNYRLTLARAPAEFVVPTGDQGGPLTNGQNHPGHIDLGDLDIWTFTGQQAAFVTLSMSRVGVFDANFTPWIRLVSPTGVLLDSRVGSVAQISRTLGASGT
jgi:hypothetical protein